MASVLSSDVFQCLSSGFYIVSLTRPSLCSAGCAASPALHGDVTHPVLQRGYVVWSMRLELAVVWAAEEVDHIYITGNDASL